MTKIKDADVQYNDMKGTSAMDFHASGSEINQYAIDKGINLEIYTPIALRVYFGEIDYFSLNFIVKENGTQICHEISVTETQSDFFSRFKRLEILLSLKNENLNEYDLGEIVNIE